jgi:drug/metabolite transporter (DMT)-like permease
MPDQPMRDRPSGFFNPWFQLALNIIGVVVYELLLKTGAKATADFSKSWAWTGITGLASPLIWLAIVLIILDLIIWLYVLKYIPLSIAFPLSRLVDVLVPISCWLILKEGISSLRWCGIALVIVGLAVVAKPAARLEERL